MKRDPQIVAAAARLGMSPAAIRHRIATWGDRERALTEPRAPGRPATRRASRPPRRVVAWDTVAWGTLTDREIAAQLGVHPMSVSNYRRRNGIAPSQPQHPWTEAQDDALAEIYWSSWTPRARAALARELGRTPAALKARAGELALAQRARPEDRWPRSLERLERDTGYEACRIRNAAARLGMRLHRRGPGKVAPHYAISEEQATRILAYLASIPDGSKIRRRSAGEWARGERCVDCGRDTVQRASRQRCTTCYPKHLHATRASRAA